MNSKSKNTKQFSILTYSIAITIVSLLIFLFSSIGFIDAVNNIFLDALHGEVEAREEIVIVKIDDASLNEIGSWPWDRKIFADGLINITKQNPSVIGIDVLFFEERSGDDELEKFINKSEVPIVLGSKFIDEQVNKSIYPDALSGFVNFEQDPDGKIRKTITSLNNDGECEVSLSLQLASQFFFINNNDLICGETVSLRFEDYHTNNKELIFGYTRNEFSSISFKDVVNSAIEDEFFKDKIVIIGSTALDLRSNLNDNFTSVFGSNIAGVEIHANIINSYLNNTFYSKPNIVAVAIIVVVINFLIAYIDFRFKKLYLGTILLAFLLIANFFLSIFLFSFNFQSYFIQTTLALISAYLFSILIKYTLQNREARYIKNVFSRYLNEHLLDILITDTSKLSLGGETKNMTVLFSDIRGFTSISEKMTSQELITMINDYLGFMTNLILRNNGTIDKYIGDAIMAFWNAPIDDHEHATNSIRTAIEMKSELRKFRKVHPQYPEIKIGIGVNSGDMTVGNVGGEKRFDYTILGDNVNLGSRLEGLTKKYGVTTIISENTYDKVIKEKNSNKFIFRMLDEVKVKGKDIAIKIYEPMIKNKSNNNIKKIYEEGFSSYQKGNFKKAVSILSELNEPASTNLIERINLMKAPPNKWKGIWIWEEK